MKRLVTAIFVIFVLSLSFIPGDSFAQEGVFLTNLLSGKCIDVYGTPGDYNGAPLKLWDCELSGKGLNDTLTDQK